VRNGGQQAVGDNARKGTVKKRSQFKSKLAGATAWTKRNKKGGEFMGVKKTGQEEKSSQEVQRCATREVLT